MLVDVLIDKTYENPLQLTRDGETNRSSLTVTYLPSRGHLEAIKPFSIHVFYSPSSLWKFSCCGASLPARQPVCSFLSARMIGPT